MNIYGIKKTFFLSCVCINEWLICSIYYCKSNSAKAWEKNVVEAIEYYGRIWVNQWHLGITNTSHRAQYYSDEFKKMKCEIQECSKYQPCRMFFENTLAVDITMSAVKTQAVCLGINLELNNMITYCANNNH